MSASGDPYAGLNYWERCGEEFDRAICVLTGGPLGETVSMRAALAAEHGQRWGVILCLVLSYAVQRDHCRATLSSAPSPWFVYVRAGIAFGVAIGAVSAMVFSLLRLVLAVL